MFLTQRLFQQQDMDNALKIHKQTIATFFLTMVSLAISARDAGSTHESLGKIAPPGINKSFYSCLDKTSGSVTDNALCIMNEKDNQNARLNKAYKKLLASSKGEAQNRAIASEKAWEISRARDSSFEDQLYDKDSQIADLEKEKNDIFRLCERANVIDRYLAIANLLQ